MSSQCETAVLLIIIIGIIIAGCRPSVLICWLVIAITIDQNTQEHDDDHHHHQDHQDNRNLLAHLLTSLPQQPLTCFQLLQLPLQVVVHLLIILIKTLSTKIIMIIIVIQLLQLPLQVVVHFVSRFQWQHHHLILINYKHRP